MQKPLQEALGYLGLTSEQAKVYLAALRLGEGTVQDLAVESGVPRTSIYNFLKELLKKRILFASKRKRRTVYSAAHPNQLVEIEKVRLRELEGLLPDFLAMHQVAKQKSKVSFYEGAGGIKDVLSDMLLVGEPICGWSDYNAMSSNLGEYYFDVFPPERARRKIISRNIVCDTPEARKFAKQDAKYHRESKFWAQKNLNVEINVYGNKVALNSYHNNTPFVALIEDAAIATALRAIWQEQWRVL